MAENEAQEIEPESPDLECSASDSGPIVQAAHIYNIINICHCKKRSVKTVLIVVNSIFFCLVGLSCVFVLFTLAMRRG